MLTDILPVHITSCRVFFYVYGSMHRWSILITVQRDAKQSSLFIILQRGKDSLATLEGGSCTKIWPVPEAAVTVLCTPDDGCGWHPKNVEWTCRIINRLICVASCWTIINIHPVELSGIYIYICVCMYIQGVTGGTDQTSGGCSLC